METKTALTTDQIQTTSIGRAALVAGLAVLLMAVTVPVVEFYIFPKLIDYKNAGQTAKNIADEPRLFSLAIFIHFITIICDLIIAWALYIFLRPVNRNLSLLTAWFRILYAAFNIVALSNLIQVSAVIGFSEPIRSDVVSDSILIHLKSFDLQWRFGFVFFGIYLILLGYLVFKAKYVSRIIGIVLMIAGAGYLIENLKYFFYPNFNTGFLWFTYFGELIFMFWLLIKGSRLKISEET